MVTAGNPLSAPGDISEAAEVPPIGSSGWAANFRPSTNIEDRRGQDPEIARMWALVNAIKETPPGDAVNLADQYNTKLSPKQEAAYQAWGKKMAAQGDGNPAVDTNNYDMRGLWHAADGNPQFADAEIYKKPNHPTFSTYSQYHGVDGHEGGTWGGGQNGDPWTFTPGATNLQMWGG
jgi:hypothetical protein